MHVHDVRGTEYRPSLRFYIYYRKADPNGTVGSCRKAQELYQTRELEERNFLELEAPEDDAEEED